MPTAPPSPFDHSEDDPFSPRDYLRNRRPEQFSDTVIDEIPVLDRALLEFHLETLTTRGQEKEFEHFARKLAEKTICPNLLPQTGPTGGGDSQVDAETYPVADSLALGWYVGIGQEAASERWAFAFSAKKDWRSKLRSDVDKIAKTQRGYTKAFFVTNQSVPDRVRAQIEDELRKKHKLDVRILDRTWILDRVFSGKLKPLAIESLRIAVSKAPDVRTGPRDTERAQELEELERRITAALQGGRAGPKLAEDCLDAAILTRNLERPRLEVEGQLARAERIAAHAGTDHQRLRSAYLWAWTSYFWYEDYNAFLKWYKEAEDRGKNSRNSHDLELLLNLWSLLYTATRAGYLPPDDAAVPQRAQILTSALERLSNEEGRPSNTLHARTLLLQMRLTSSGGQNVEPTLRELAQVVREAEGLVGYPLEPLVEVLTELGGFLDGNPVYEELFELIVEVTSKREGELKGARMLLKRGVQQMDASRPYEAIRTLGRALRRLHKHESRDELSRALYLCGAAYEQAGLLWAARGSVLYAASVATNDFWTHSEISPLQAACYRKMKWLELKLGRIPHLLAWHELDQAIRANLGTETPSAREKDFHLDMQFSLILGLLLLRADLWQLRAMARLPDALDDNGLPLSAAALMYALGHEEDLPAEFLAVIPGGVSLHDFFMQWRRQTAGEDVPESPLLHEGRLVTLTSQVLGCRIRLECENAPDCIALSESLLAALESLFSTAIHQHVMAREPLLTLNVRHAQFADPPFGFELLDRAGRPHVEIRCTSLNPHTLPAEIQAAIARKIFDLLIELFARVFWVPRPEETLSQLLREENAPERALQFTTSFVTLGNVLGHEPRTTLSAWTGSELREYPVRRSEEWDAQARIAEPHQQRQRVPSGARSEATPTSWDSETIKHTDIETVSLIRESFWNRAGWHGTVYLTDPEGTDPPLLGLVFRNPSVAEQIFSQWREELGVRDAEEQLRILIVRRIDRTHPHAYRVVIGAQPSKIGGKATRWSMMSRLCRMDPDTDENLERFLRAYATAGEYVLVPALRTEEDPVPSPLPGHLFKRELHVREAWEIGMNEPDAVGIDPDEEPIIPEDQKDAPVIELICWLRAREAQS
jgi:tetratricopeptide (TPR) repeat protein